MLQDTGFPARLRQLLEKSGVSAASLELEITESAMMLDPARALRVIQDIDKLGVLISIDDFGTGYSSLGYLRDLPVHALKIDRSFVAGMRNNADDRIIVESTAQMAHAMRLELVAEGVEPSGTRSSSRPPALTTRRGSTTAARLPGEQCLAWIAEFNATAMACRRRQDDHHGAAPPQAGGGVHRDRRDLAQRIGRASQVSPSSSAVPASAPRQSPAESRCPACCSGSEDFR